MLIGINPSNYRIEQLHEVTISSLIVCEIDRKMIFKDMSDRRILNYCYKPSEKGYSIYPAIPSYEIEKNEKDEEILILQYEIIETEYENLQ